MIGSDEATPARRAARPGPPGVWVLAEEGAGEWAHGGEWATEAALLAASDRSDMSDELAWQGRGWPQQADCARERGHLLRGLDLDPECAVLEVGAGAGAVTRSLAERCRVVDALELNPGRARLAALRLADLPNARVLVGDVHDVPAEAAYDVIVMVGVLEYVGGHGGIRDRVDFLEMLRARLRPGGHVVCAIENRFGVGYLAGGAEDHSGRLFQAVEGHPARHPARTFGRVELERLFARSGLHPTTLGVFPDYRFPRVVFSRALLDSEARPLAYDVPRFPSPPHPSFASATIIDERRLWQGLVANGMGLDFPNSFLVVAGRDGPQELWRDEQLAAFYTVGRRRSLITETVVTRGADGVQLTRRRLSPDEPVPAPLAQRSGVMAYVNGPCLLDVLDEADQAEVGDRLRALREHIVATSVEEDGVAFDIWPDNVVVAADVLVTVDVELTDRRFTPDAVFARALLLTSLALAQGAGASRWDVHTPRALLARLAGLSGVAVDIEETLAAQADSIALVFAGDPGSDAYNSCYEHALADLRARLDTPLVETNIWMGARDAGPGWAARLHQQEVELCEIHARAERAEDELARLRGVGSGLTERPRIAARLLRLALGGQRG